jgi:hypothetical protein
MPELPSKTTRVQIPQQTAPATPASWLSLLHGGPFQGALILLATAVAYYHTLDVPFYLDDYLRIRENSLIYDWQGFAALWQYGPMRIIGYLSFALNYQIGQFDPTGYHLVNILIHWLTGMAVYFFTRVLLRTPRLADTVSEPARTWLPLFVALLFVLHPLQTQAVTYIVQRLASLAALFYISSMTCFLRARMGEGGRVRTLWLALSLCFALLAFFTKQNTFTLPFALLLLEMTLFPVNWRRLALAGGVAVGGLAVAWLLFASLFHYDPLSLAAMEKLTRETTEISRAAYLATQLPVLWVYLRLFAWPSGLHVDYAMEALDGFRHGVVWLALAGHFLVLGFAFSVWRRWPLVTFAVLFYYLAHGIESSFLPITDVVFEHRTYLPNLGLCLLAGWIVLDVLPRWIPSKVVGVIAVVVLILLGYATWQRNQVWRDPVGLWTQNVEVAPTKARAWSNLGRQLLEANRPRDGARAAQESINLQLQKDPTAVLSRPDILNMITALYLTGQYEKAMALTDQFIDQPMTQAERSRFYVNQGLIYGAQLRYPEAEASFRTAVQLTPFDLPARESLGRVLAQSGRLAEAESVFVELQQIDPDNEQTRHMLHQIRAARARQTAGSRP